MAARIKIYGTPGHPDGVLRGQDVRVVTVGDDGVETPLPVLSCSVAIAGRGARAIARLEMHVSEVELDGVDVGHTDEILAAGHA